MDNFSILRLKLKKNHKNKYLRNIDYQKFFGEKEIEYLFDNKKGVFLVHEILNKILLYKNPTYNNIDIKYINYFFTKYLLSSYDNYINTYDFLTYNNNNLWIYLINNLEESELKNLYENIYCACIDYNINFDVIHRNLYYMISMENKNGKKILTDFYIEESLIESFISLLRLKLINTNKNRDLYNIRLIKYMNIRVDINNQVYKKNINN